MSPRRSRALAAVLLAAGVLAASVPEPSTTLATLSDAATVAGSAQAAVLTIDVRVAGADGQPATRADGVGDRLTTTVSGPLAWSLSVELLPADGEQACPSATAAEVTVALGDQSVLVVPCGGPEPVRSAEGPWTGVLVLQGGSTDGDVFDGALTVRVDQAGGGFHDEVDVAVRLGAAEPTTAASAEPPADAAVVDGPVGGGGSSTPPVDRPSSVPPAPPAETPSEAGGGPAVLPDPAPSATQPGAEVPVDEDAAGSADPPPEEGSATEEPAPDPAG